MDKDNDEHEVNDEENSGPHPLFLFIYIPTFIIAILWGIAVNITH